MVWEIQRTDWSRLRADRVPEALRALHCAASDQEASLAYSSIESAVVAQGALYEAAVPTTACLISVLQRCTPAARPYILELLVQLGTGEPAPSEIMAGAHGLQDRCKVELAKGFCIYLNILEDGSEKERTLCIELLGLCAQQVPSVAPRVTWYLQKLVSEPISTGLKDLAITWQRAVQGSSR
ncbi:MAG: hypothetical protein HUU21_01245 [Polyangiaceae bacterium]|nr:hypothetical protein [Polyangiaceae bacterium]NUQ72192.1 hypothetical protein [Polyangiaceae bacterium]